MKYIFIILVTILSCNFAYSHETYNLTISNNTNNYLYVYGSDDYCMYHYSIFLNLKPHITASTDNIQDNNGFGKCAGARKHFKINFIAYTPDSYWLKSLQAIHNHTLLDKLTYECVIGKLPIPYKQHCKPISILQTQVEFSHGITNGSWQTEIESDANGNSNYLEVLKATCGADNCLNTYGSGGENIKLTLGYNPNKPIPILPGYYKLDAIGLGKVYVTGRYNRILKQTKDGKIYIGAQNATYTFHFSTTARGCTLINGYFQCPNSVSASIPSDMINTILFVCQQSSSTESKCPWVLSDNDNNTNAINFYNV
ncbi:hypothetical protein L3V82_07135 [Thiotrichales bacterium 19S3-7]|nr:hypothetical protein [Thiotrichales bacterium 19S3-7]MCF6801932.1 hypothetical protein [Thiotrichales bacterium 19S3-11]